MKEPEDKRHDEEVHVEIERNRRQMRAAYIKAEDLQAVIEAARERLEQAKAGQAARKQKLAGNGHIDGESRNGAKMEDGRPTS